MENLRGERAAGGNREVAICPGRRHRCAERIDGHGRLGAEHEVPAFEREAANLKSRVGSKTRGELPIVQRHAVHPEGGARSGIRRAQHVREIPAPVLPRGGGADTIQDQLLEMGVAAEPARVVAHTEALDPGDGFGITNEPDVLQVEAVQPVAAHPPYLNPVVGIQWEESGEPADEPGRNRGELEHRKHGHHEDEKTRGDHPDSTRPPPVG